MHSEDIKAAIRKRFGSLRALENAAALSPKSISDVLRGRTSARTESAIASALGFKPEVIWPSRYHSGVGRPAPAPVDNYALTAASGKRA